MEKLVALIVALFVLVIILSQIDDPLSDESKALLEKIEDAKSNNAYFYLLGIFASPQDDPILVGKQEYEELVKAQVGSDYQTSEYPDSKKLPIPDGNTFCSYRNKGCLSSLFGDDIDIGSLLAENEVLLKRVSELYKYGNYRTLTKPTVAERTFPRHRYIFVANRLTLLSGISMFKNGNSEDAINLLMSNIANLRKQMALQDTLIGKLSYLMQISEHIDVVSIVLSKSNRDKQYSIPNLKWEEKTLEVPIAREFAMGYNTLKSLDRMPNFFKSKVDGYNLPSWVVRMVFKPNMTLNSSTKKFYRAIDLSHLEPHQFSAQVKADEQDNRHISVSGYLRNFQGQIMNAISSPMFDDFISRFMDLDVKIALFNQYYLNNQDLQKVRNPYSKDQHASIKENRICVTGPMEDDRNLRCIAIST